MIRIDKQLVSYILITILALLAILLLYLIADANIITNKGKVIGKTSTFIDYYYNYETADEVDEIIINSRKFFEPSYYQEYTSYEEIDLTELYPGLVKKKYFSEGLNKKHFFDYSKIYVDRIVTEKDKGGNKSIVCFYLDLGVYSNYKSTPGYLIINYNKDFEITGLEEKY